MHDDNEEKTEKKFCVNKKVCIAIISGVVVLGLILISIPFACMMSAVHSLKIHQYDKAIQYINMGNKFYKNDAEMFSLRGYAKYQLGDFDGAIDDFDNAYKYTKDKLDLTNFDNKIYVKYIVNNYNGAIADFDSEMEKTSGSPEHHDTILWDKAQFLYNIGKYKEALACYNELIVSADNDMIYLLKDRLYAERAQVNLELGNSEQAQKDLELAGADSLENSKIPLPTLVIDKL